MKNIFSPINRYEPCGIFSFEHINIIIISTIILISAIFLSRKRNIEYIKRIHAITAIFITIAECVKISFNFYHGYVGYDNWMPLSFCSFFIYSSWLSVSKNPFLRKLGISFVCGAGIVSGLSFIIFPSTSLSLYPWFHYLSLYSIIYHLLFAYFGIIYMIKSEFKFNFEYFKFYLLFTVPAVAIALIFSLTTKTNMMFLMDPYKIPVQFLYDLKNFNQSLYTLCVFAGYVTIPFFVPAVIIKVVEKIKQGII